MIIQVLANDSDVDEDTLSVGSVGTASHGTVVISGGGTTVTYTPEAWLHRIRQLQLCSQRRAGRQQ